MTIKLVDITKKILEYNSAADIDLVNRAYTYSAKLHQGQTRRSGDPYIDHPLEVAAIITNLKLDVPSVCAALLHDTLEDTLATLEDLKKFFSEEIAFLVDGVTKLSKYQFKSQEERQAENFRKMLVSMAKDIRVLLVKLADRTHNMRTLQFMPEEKQLLIARETLDIYAPLANRLGIAWMKVDLEDLSFKYTAPEDYRMLSDKVAQTRADRAKYTRSVIEIIEHELKNYQLDFVVTGRPKHFYSIFRKMKLRGVEYEQLSDVIAFRVILQAIPQCYEVLGIVHNLWKPVPGRFKDYIALPKPNLYQSLHTTVIGPFGERVEIQIRTEQMHLIAEDGIAAHWRYKEAGKFNEKDHHKFGWLRQLVENQQEMVDPNEFMESLKIDLFADEVFVFSPKGEVVSFPTGATPVDFAFAIHTEIGNHCVGAKVNGQIVPLRHELQNGDVTEIMTSQNQKPNKDWLKFVVSSKAKTKIRQFIRTEQRQRSLEFGREICEKEFKRYDLTLNKVVKNDLIQKPLQYFNYKTVEDLFVAVGYGKITPEQIVKQILPSEKVEELKKRQSGEGESRLTQIIKKIAGQDKTGVKINGMENILIKFAKCCNPLPGDKIIGFITRGRGITIHVQSCQKILDLDPERRIDVYWDEKSKPTRLISIKVCTVDCPGILAKISQSFSANGINISQANCKTTEDKKAVNSFLVAIKDLQQLNAIINAIEKIDGVYSVERAHG